MIRLEAMIGYGFSPFRKYAEATPIGSGGLLRAFDGD
jgi:hypothetical protein